MFDTHCWLFASKLLLRFFFFKRILKRKRKSKSRLVSCCVDDSDSFSSVDIHVIGCGVLLLNFVSLDTH